MPNSQGPKTVEEQLETTKALLKKMSERCDRAELTLSNLYQWTTEYGKALCPGDNADTFGEGIHAAKEQVRRLLKC